MQEGPNTVEIWTVPPSPYLLITLKAIELEKRLVVICKVLKMFVTIFTGDGNCSLLNRDNIRQPILMQLSQKQKSFSRFVPDFFKCRLNFDYFQEKDDPNS